MLFNYSELGPTRFEKLIIEICADLLGEGIQSFSTGKDRGQDAIFEGKANKYPSEREPWEGKIIIQAKYIEENNATYSDRSFYNPKTESGIFNKELIKLGQYIEGYKISCTHYMLWSNRKKTPQNSENLKTAIAKKLRISSMEVGILGISDLDRHLKNLPSIAREFGLLKDVIEPFSFDPNDLAEVICDIHKIFVETNIIKDREIPDFRRIKYQQKADKNLMTLDYAKCLEQYMPYIDFINEFLSDPFNERIKDNYNESLVELQPKIISYLSNGISFNKIFEDTFDIIKNKQNIQNLERRRKELIRTVLFYMFFNCDIGYK